MYLCGSGDYQSYLALVNSWGALGTGMIWTVKTGLAFSFAYHLVNGVRHLVSLKIQILQISSRADMIQCWAGKFHLSPRYAECLMLRMSTTFRFCQCSILNLP